jgi:hypothetical protein
MVDKEPSVETEFNACAPIKEPSTYGETTGRNLKKVGGVMATAGLTSKIPEVFFAAAGVTATGFAVEHVAYERSSLEHRQREFLEKAGITNTDIMGAYRAVHGADTKMPDDLLAMARDPQTLKILKSQASLHTPDAEWALNQFSTLEAERLSSGAPPLTPVQNRTTKLIP